MNVDSWILKILEEGLSLNFVSQPKPYEEKNNKSALDNLPAVREKVKDWLNSGSVEKVSSKPFCVNPLSLITKIDNGTNKLKHRPCIDMSRYINPLVKKESCKLDDLNISEQLLNRFDYQCTLDLKNQFFHVKLNPEHKKFFGFMLPNEAGTPEYYTFTVMAYGVRPAVNVVTRLLKPTKEFLHRLGVKFSIYIDDGRVIAASSKECWDKFQATLLILQLQGWNIQMSKTSTSPSQQLTYLGFITDTHSMRYFAPSQKITLIKTLLSEAIEKISKRMKFTARELASILGKIHSLHKSHGSCVFMCRQTQHLLGTAVTNQGWETTLLLNDLSRRELDYILKNLDFYNGTVISNAPGAGSLVPFKELQDSIRSITNEEVISDNLLVSDASDDVSFVYAKGDIQLVKDFIFSPQERLLSSGHRELLGLLKTLENCPEFFRKLSNPVLFWQTDSQNAALFVKKGSKKPKIQTDVLRIKELERFYDIKICPIWTPRTHSNIDFADIGSKLHLSTDEFSINLSDLNSIFRQMNLFPTVDTMASDKNFKMTKFFSLIPQQFSSGINFLAQPLCEEEIYYCCPPVKSIIPVFKKLTSTKNVKSILVVPNWPSAYFWPILYPDGTFSKFIKQYVVFKPKISSYTIVSSLFEKSPQYFIALKIVT